MEGSLSESDEEAEAGRRAARMANARGRTVVEITAGLGSEPEEEAALAVLLGLCPRAAVEGGTLMLTVASSEVGETGLRWTTMVDELGQGRARRRD